MLKTIKIKLYNAWLKVKSWIIGVLVLLGLVAAPLLAQQTDFTYTAATAYVTGEPMPITDIEFTRLYCDGVMVAEEAGADLSITADLSVGTHDCYGTHVAGGLESSPSNTVQRVITLGPPNPPVLD